MCNYSSGVAVCNPGHVCSNALSAAAYSFVAAREILLTRKETKIFDDPDEVRTKNLFSAAEV